jgi:ATP:ADP antiporter, AAA family
VIFFGVQVIRFLGWRIGAIATPTVMAIVSFPFFLCILWPGSSLDKNPIRLQTAVLFGTLTSLLSKTSKYALFDPTTQMAYIPLDEESKIKGKAAIDVLGSRIGKSGGSLIQQGLVLLFGTILSASPIVGVLYYIVLFIWIHSANQLSTLFQQQSDQHEQKEQDNNELLQEEEEEERSTNQENKKEQ